MIFFVNVDSYTVICSDILIINLHTHPVIVAPQSGRVLVVASAKDASAFASAEANPNWGMRP